MYFIWPTEGVPVHIVVTHRGLHCTCIHVYLHLPVKMVAQTYSRKRIEKKIVQKFVAQTLILKRSRKRIIVQGTIWN